MSMFGIFKKESGPLSCSAVVVAAGSSQRMGSDKVMARLGSIPVLARTLMAFQRSPLVDEIIVVTKMDKITEVAELCKRYGISKTRQVISGGNTRMESALAGVSAVKQDAKLIAIHDGARPLVTQELIQRTVEAAAAHMSAVPAIASTDTLKQIDEKGVVVAGLDRDRVVRVQTPQVFNADLIKGALTKAVNDGLALTDDCSAVEMMGLKTHTVVGDEENIKLTAPRDMSYASAILQDRGEYS